MRKGPQRHRMWYKVHPGDIFCRSPPIESTRSSTRSEILAFNMAGKKDISRITSIQYYDTWLDFAEEITLALLTHWDACYCNVWLGGLVTRLDKCGNVEVRFDLIFRKMTNAMNYFPLTVCCSVHSAGDKLGSMCFLRWLHIHTWAEGRCILRWSAKAPCEYLF